MNVNAIRSILNLLSGGALTSILTTIAKCTGDNPLTPELEAAVCTAAWIPLQYQALAGLAFVGIGFVLKMFGSGSIKQNIAAPIAPIVPKAEAKVGVVTAEQVATPGTGK